MPRKRPPTPEELRERAMQLRLHGLLSDWANVGGEPWVKQLIELEEVERARRSQEYRMRNAKIGNFKSRGEFDWKHPSKIDRLQIDELFTLDFVDEGQNVIFLGPNGVGKTLFARNLAYASVTRGWATRYVSASDMLNDLSSYNGSMLHNRLKRYVSPRLLVIDELGYLSYDNHHADLLYEVVSRRYEQNASIVLTTNRPFAQWNQVFEGSACLTTLIDRLCHRVEIVKIDGDSYRQSEGQASARTKRASRKKKKPPAKRK
ncbi:MAG: ATP-binding protein [Polyangiaceae bacterium]|nr:ATP-binding protein [Polyangiaceae bacterium]